MAEGTAVGIHGDARLPECIEVVAQIEARIANIERTQQAQNGALRALVDRVGEVRADLGEKLGEIHGTLQAQVRHAEAWEKATEAYRVERAKQEESSQREPSGKIAQTAAALSSWKFGLGMLVGGLLILAAFFMFHDPRRAGDILHDMANKSRAQMAEPAPAPTR